MDIKDQITVMKSALETRMGKKGAEEFYDRAAHESKNELGFGGNVVEENALLERILWRLTRKNEELVELERRDNKPH